MLEKESSDIFYLMISACIVNVINRLSITHNQLTPWKAPASILDQVSWSKTKSNKVKCKLNNLFSPRAMNKGLTRLANNALLFEVDLISKNILPIDEIDGVFEIFVRLYIVNRILRLIKGLQV